MSNPVDAFTTIDTINSLEKTLSEKYLGNTQTVLSATSTRIISSTIISLAPYANLANRYFPTVATLPNNPANFLTEAQIGGYFLPKNLGISTYLTKDITYSLDTTQLSAGYTYRYINPATFNKGRGLTKTDQSNIINHITSPDWMKSNYVSYDYDGNIINADSFQKFIPYQSKYETTKNSSNGIVIAQNNFEFWNGPKKDKWIENNADSKLDKEKYFNLQSQIEDLVITPGFDLYSWHTDIYGTQYGLYKRQILSAGYYNSPVTKTNTLSSFNTGIGKIYRFHNGDYKKDGRIDADELNRIIELYNYQVGSTRFGFYHNDPTSIDGFAPGPGIITYYHDADLNQNGKIDLTDLTEIIDIYNTVGSTESMYQKQFLPGVLWVKTLDNNTATASASLSAVYQKYINNSTVYRELSSNLISTFEVFFDTLVFETPSVVLYEKVYLDYDTYQIKTSTTNYLPINLGLTNNTAIITDSLTGGVVSPTVNTYYGGNWYDSHSKTVTICTLLSGTLSASSVSGLIVPVLYQFNINDSTDRKRIYPTDTTDFSQYLRNDPYRYIEPPVFTYNKDTNTYVVTHLAYGTSQKVDIINYKINL